MRFKMLGGKVLKQIRPDRFYLSGFFYSDLKKSKKRLKITLDFQPF